MNNLINSETMDNRNKLIFKLFPEGLPRLWCPTLTHFSSKGVADENRMRRHWHYLSPYVKGILIPGSTGEGWEMNDRDIMQLLEVVLAIAGETGIKILVGVLKTDVSSVLECIRSVLELLRQRTGISDDTKALVASSVVGFTVCPPKGSHLSQTDLANALSVVAGTGLPLAVYQLPQVTGNELAPEIISELSTKYSNFYLFKDTSGFDRVALSNADFHKVFLVRGAEGKYHQWLKETGGPYDGFLLSTANVFAAQYAGLITMLEAGQYELATGTSEKTGRVVEACFKLVAGFPHGNAFTNANKVLDHLMAYGPGGLHTDPPLLYSGVRLPVSFIKQAAELLRQEGLFPVEGYMNQ